MFTSTLSMIETLTLAVEDICQGMRTFCLTVALITTNMMTQQAKHKTVKDIEYVRNVTAKSAKYVLLWHSCTGLKNLKNISILKAALINLKLPIVSMINTTPTPNMSETLTLSIEDLCQGIGNLA